MDRVGRNCDNERLSNPNSTENALGDEEEEEEALLSNSGNEGEDEEEEALSLADLPINGGNPSKTQESQPTKAKEGEGGGGSFDFGSWVGSVLGAESEMCAADEVFFQGQILPFRHSVSSDGGSAGLHTRWLWRSESMDRFNSGVFTSRSSSMSSHNSSSSSSGNSIKTVPTKGRVRNRFHSHPSPSPQIRVPNFPHGNSGRRSQKSSMWRFLQVGVVRTPNIELQNLKNRSVNQSVKSFGSGTNFDRDLGTEKREKQSQLRWFDGKGGLMLGGCKCSVNVVETTTTIATTTKFHPRRSEMEKEERENMTRTSTTLKRKEKKKAMSRRRTFEWLKELPAVAGAHDEEVV